MNPVNFIQLFLENAKQFLFSKLQEQNYILKKRITKAISSKRCFLNANTAYALHALNIILNETAGRSSEKKTIV